MKRKLISLILLLVLVFSCTAGAKTLKVLIRPDEGNIIQLYSEQFEKETGIKVEVNYVGWDQISTKITAALLDQGGGYDIIFIPSADKLRFAAMGQFVDLNPWFSQEEKGQFLASIVNYYTYQDQMIGVPWYSGGAHFIYNADYLAGAGLKPEEIKTWQDLLEVGTVIKEQSSAEYAFAPSAKYPGNYYFNYGSIVMAMGGRFFDDNLNPVFNQGIGLTALEILVEGVEKGVFNPAGTTLDDYETLKVFQAGKSAFLLDSSWAANQTMVPAVSTVADQAKVMMIPGSKENATGGLLYAGALGITRSSQHKEEAIEFVKLLTGNEAQLLHAILGNNLPTRLSLFTGERMEAINQAWPAYGKLVAQVEKGQFGPDILWLDPFRRTLATAVQDALSGKKTPQEALDWAAEQARQIKAQYQ